MNILHKYLYNINYTFLDKHTIKSDSFVWWLFNYMYLFYFYHFNFSSKFRSRLGIDIPDTIEFKVNI